jgi:prophage DNA circulation protein
MGWRDQLVPASFRGVPFQVQSGSPTSGRRIDVHEYAYRDRPSTDDLGRRAEKWRVRGFILAAGDGAYAAQRDALYSVCRDYAAPALLFVPWLPSGRLVRCETVTYTESIEAGGEASFDMEFVEAGAPAGPLVSVDTAASIIDSTATAMGVLVTTLQVAADIAAAPGLLLGAAQFILGIAALQLFGTLSAVTGLVSAALLPGGLAAEAVFAAVAAAQASVGSAFGMLTLGNVATTSAVTGLVGDPVAIAVTDMFTLAASAVLAVQTAPPDVQDAIGGQLLTYQRVAQDPTLGLINFAIVDAAVPMPTGLGAAAQAQMQGDLTALIAGAATLAVARIYANTDFTSSNAAQAARTLLLGLINDQIQAAAASANNALYQAWVSLAGQISQDLLQRILQLPQLTTYTLPQGVPAVVLAQKLYQDGTRGTQLALLNDCPHPGFLPPTGAALSS